VSDFRDTRDVEVSAAVAISSKWQAGHVCICSGVVGMSAVMHCHPDVPSVNNADTCMLVLANNSMCGTC
jgi:hypothetical protein